MPHPLPLICMTYLPKQTNLTMFEPSHLVLVSTIFIICFCGCCCCRCCCCWWWCKPLGSGKVRLVQQPFPYLPWHLSAPEQSRSQVREGATRITVFLKLLEVRVVGLRSRQESNSIWVRRNSLVTQSLNHSLHVRVKEENFLTRGQ